ncbi:MAG: RICIN domain-containing protein [Bacteroidetes bacterium]|nr:RICIN domain-containing protein [Bacteroidota bacterium]
MEKLRKDLGKNRNNSWLLTAAFLFISGMTFSQHVHLEIGNVKPEWWSAQWSIENAPDGSSSKRITNRWTSTHLHHEYPPSLMVGDAPDGWWSAMWILEKIEGTSAYRIKNRYTQVYLHNEFGKIEAGTIKEGWWSAMWELVNTGTGNWVRIRNRHTGQYLHTENQRSESQGQGNPGFIDISGFWSKRGDNFVQKVSFNADLSELIITEYDYPGGNPLPNRKFTYKKTANNIYVRESTGSRLEALSTTELKYSRANGSHETIYERETILNQYENQLKSSEIDALLQGVRHDPMELNTGAIPSGISSRNSGKLNMGNHTQGFTKINEDLFAVTYTQWNGVPDNTIKANPSQYNDLIIVAGKDIYYENNVPTVSWLGVNDLASCGNILIAGWGSEIEMYKINPKTGSITIFNTGLNDPTMNFNSTTWLGLTRYQGDYYLATKDAHDKLLGLWRYSGEFQEGVNNWVFLGAQEVNFPTSGISSNPRKTGGFSLVASENGLHVIVNYCRKSMDNIEYVAIFNLNANPHGEDLYSGEAQITEDWVMSPTAIPRFRFSSGAYVNEKGELEIYSTAAHFLERKDGALEVFKHTPK